MTAERLRPLLSPLCVLAAALMLLLPAALTHRPSVFFDTESYYLQGARTLNALHLVPAPLMRTVLTEQTPEQRAVNDTLLKARSPFYGTFFFASAETIGLWGTVFLQALAVAWSLWVLFGAAARTVQPRTYLATMAGLTLATTLPFFAAFATPDIFAAVAGVCAITLAVYRDRLRRGEQAGMAALLVFACLCHTSHILIVGALSLAAAFVVGAFGAPRPNRVMARRLLIGAALLASVISAGYFAAWKAGTGETLRRPPFLSARMLADGPGRTYLRAACADTPDRWMLCRFKGQRLDNSEDILWNEAPGAGVYNTLTRPERIRMADEDAPFAVAVATHKPLQQALASTLNWAKQLAMIHLAEPLRDHGLFFTNAYFKRTSLPRLIPNADECRDGACASPFGENALLLWHKAALLAALGVIGWRLTRADGLAFLRGRKADWDEDLVRLAAVLALTALFIAINALVCGAISGPFARYQARIIWMMPMLAGLTLAVLPWRREPLVQPNV